MTAVWTADEAAEHLGPDTIAHWEAVRGEPYPLALVAKHLTLEGTPKPRRPLDAVEWATAIELCRKAVRADDAAQAAIAAGRDPYGDQVAAGNFLATLRRLLDRS